MKKWKDNLMIDRENKKTYGCTGCSQHWERNISSPSSRAFCFRLLRGLRRVKNLTLRALQTQLDRLTGMKEMIEDAT